MYNNMSYAPSKSYEYVSMDNGDAIRWCHDDHTYLITQDYDPYPIDPYDWIAGDDDIIYIYNCELHNVYGDYQCSDIYDCLMQVADQFSAFSARMDNDQYKDLINVRDEFECLHPLDAIKVVQDFVGNEYHIYPIELRETYEAAFLCPDDSYIDENTSIILIKSAYVNGIVDKYPITSDNHDFDYQAWIVIDNMLTPYVHYINGNVYSYDLFELVGDHYEYIENSGTCYGDNILTNGACEHGLDIALQTGEYELYKVTPVTTFEVSPVQNPNGEFYKLLYV